MTSFLNPRERFTFRVSLVLILLGALGSGFATVLHQMHPDPHPYNLFIPPFLTIILLFLSIVLFLKPESIDAVLWTAFISVLLTILFTTWYFTYKAFHSSEIALVEIYPPITSLLLPVIMGMIIFLHSRRVVTIAVASWTLVILPILIYLVSHPQELWSPRGMEMVITLGPVMMVTMILVPFRHGIEQRFNSLQNEHSRMQALAERDPLTNLYNRRGGEALLDGLIEDGETNCGLIMFDIDHFKSINDTYGHTAGDDVLREIARRCSHCLRRDDPLVRWGGEEFLVLIQRASDSDIAFIAEDLRMAIASKPIKPAGNVTASFGATQHIAAESSIVLSLQRADEALYTAKNGGRNQVSIK